MFRDIDVLLYVTEKLQEMRTTQTLELNMPAKRNISFKEDTILEYEESSEKVGFATQKENQHRIRKSVKTNIGNKGKFFRQCIFHQIFEI